MAPAYTEILCCTDRREPVIPPLSNLCDSLIITIREHLFAESRSTTNMTAKEPEDHAQMPLGLSKSHSTQFSGDEVPPETESPRSSQAEATVSHMQASFEKTVCTELELPFRYRSVAVLIIHWAEYLDRDLNCGAEVQMQYEL